MVAEGCQLILHLESLTGEIPRFLVVCGEGKICDRDRIQTCNRLIRSQLLYSIELRDLLLL